MEQDKLTSAVQEALAEAQQIAVTRHQQEIDIPQLFKFLLQPGEFGAEIFKRAGMDVSEIEREVDRELDQLAVIEGQVNYGQTLSQNLFKLLQEADKLREDFG
ncbi:Clp protease N-terminal domain-containing protein, partial [Liquorilactobacillus uvarum]